MRKILLLLLPLFMLSIAAVAPAKETVEPPASCQECGMNRTMFAHSRMLVIYADGSRTGTCSLHCMAGELKAHPDKKVSSLQVADFYSHKLIDARKAVWVVGGDRRGVMTAMPKWAFGAKSEAERFVAESGGRLVSFEEALLLAEKE